GGDLPTLRARPVDGGNMRAGGRGGINVLRTSAGFHASACGASGLYLRMLRLLSFFLLGLAGPLSAFVAPVSLGEKCSRADGIVRGVVVDIVPVTRPTEDSSGLGAEKTTDREFTGPNAIAVVRVVEV